MSIYTLIDGTSLVAGALAEQFNLPTPLSDNRGGIFWIFRPDMSGKTKIITSWLSDISCPLKKILCVMEPQPSGNGQVVSCHHFYNQQG